MKQIIQNYRTGELKIEEVPVPQCRPTSVLVRTLYSAISAGTEKTKVDTAKMSLFAKARSRPDLVKKVIQKAQKEGIRSTFEMVQKRLSQPVPLGYSCVGVVEEVGEWVEGVRPGDTVVCAGAGFANHAEFNVVPGRLAVPCPAGVPLDQASFTTIGSIALQGVRQAEPRIGEKFCVIGLGLIGQIVARLLQANGCEVFAIDLDTWKLQQAAQSGAADQTALGNDADLTEKMLAWTRGRGADGVIITASTTSNGPIEQAGMLCRDRGRVVIVGAVGTEFPREAYYMKEIDIRIARSYGPGRYDPLYEDLGLDYPVGYVRFTEQRNMEAFLDLLAQKKIDLGPLLTHNFGIDQAKDAFAMLSGEVNQNPYLGITLDYTAGKAAPSAAAPKPGTAISARPRDPFRLGFIGIGNYATAQLLPRLAKKAGVVLAEVFSSGFSAATTGKQHGFLRVASTAEELLQSEDSGTIFVVTRHDSHAEYVRQALLAGKNAFVEKPLCLDIDELARLKEAYEVSKGVLMVGFNRRFSGLTAEVKERLPEGPKQILYRVNAGKLPEGHWLNLPEVGGGRLVGEACHFIDLAAHLGGSPVKSVFATALGGGAPKSPRNTEDVQIQLTLANGTVATVVYFTNGHNALAKEYLEVHAAGHSAIIEDFTALNFDGKSEKLAKQDKGQAQMLNAFLDACRAGDRTYAPIPAASLWNTAEATFAVLESLATGKSVRIGE